MMISFKQFYIFFSVVLIVFSVLVSLSILFIIQHYNQHFVFVSYADQLHSGCFDGYLTYQTGSPLNLTTSRTSDKAKLTISKHNDDVDVVYLSTPDTIVWSSSLSEPPNYALYRLIPYMSQEGWFFISAFTTLNKTESYLFIDDKGIVKRSNDVIDATPFFIESWDLLHFFSIC